MLNLIRTYLTRVRHPVLSLHPPKTEHERKVHAAYQAMINSGKTLPSYPYSYTGHASS